MFGGCFLIFFTPTGNVYLRDLCFMTKNYSERGPWDRLSQRLYLNSGRSPCKFAVLQILRGKNMHFDVYCMQIIMKIYRFNFLPHCSCPVEVFVSRLFREEKKNNSQSAWWDSFDKTERSSNLTIICWWMTYF